MSTEKLNRQISRIDIASKREKLESPQIAQNTKAVRHPPPSVPVRRAITTAAAGAGNTITVNLYDSNGIEQTSGDESNITVYCTIVGGSALNTAIPRLENDTPIEVIQHPYWNEGIVEQRWYCAGLPFQASEVCDCYTG